MTFDGRCSGGAAPPRRMAAKSDGSMRLRAVSTSEVWVTAPRSASAVAASASKWGRTSRGIPHSIDRSMTAIPPIWAHGRHDNQLAEAAVTPSISLVRTAEARTASRVSTATFGVPEDPDVRQQTASPGSVPTPAGFFVITPAPSTIWVGWRRSICCWRCAMLRRWSTKQTASPRSSADTAAFANERLGEASKATRSGIAR